jgi:hypothetical protein
VSGVPLDSESVVLPEEESANVARMDDWSIRCLAAIGFERPKELRAHPTAGVPDLLVEATKLQHGVIGGTEINEADHIPVVQRDEDVISVVTPGSCHGCRNLPLDARLLDGGLVHGGVGERHVGLTNRGCRDDRAVLEPGPSSIREVVAREQW